MAEKRNRKVAVIGAGLGGISAAVSLAIEGFDVEVFEKNDKIGGKLNYLEKEGYSFDLGPSIIILPHLFRRLFERSGRVMEDYVEFQELHPHWRSFFEDGTKIDLFSDMKLMEKELEKLGEDADGYWRFIEYSRMLYKFAEEAYLERGADTLQEVVRGYGLREVARKTDILSTVNGGVSRYVRDPRLRDMLNYFVKYIGSSPYDAPAILNLLAYSQLGYGLYYVKGGLYNLARAYEKLMKELGVTLHLGREVKELRKNGSRIEALVLEGGEESSADIFVSNMEIIPAYRRLLREEGLMMKRYDYMFEPSCSGLVVHLGVDRLYPVLRHHNFFFSGHPEKHFDRVYHKRLLPDDPTIYLVCPTRTDRALAPRGHEVIKILPHIPYIQDKPFTQEEYVELKELLYVKLERMGLEDLRKHIVVEDMLTPDDIQRMYNSNRGSIYGVVSDWRRNMSFKAPKRSEKYDNLYFVGGSVNPGGGTCMVVLSGQKACEKIIQDL
jgi:diapolycopene oxygenase